MNRALQIAHLCVLLAVIGFLSVIGWQLDRVLRGIQSTVTKVNGPHGTIAMTDEDIGALKSTIIHADLVARHEQQQLGRLDALFASAHRLITASTGTVNAATQTLRGASLDLTTLNSSLAATKPLLETSSATVSHLNTLISDPQIPKTLTNVQSITADGARITKDAADEADKFAHPPKKKIGFWGGIWLGLTYIHRLEPPIF